MKNPRHILTAEEWVLLAKLVAIPLFILLLVVAHVTMTVPAEKFLYGRF